MAYLPLPIKNEDAASADGDAGIPILAVRKATPANTSGTDGDYEPLQVSGGKLWVDASGTAVPITDNSGSLTVDNNGTFAVQADTELTTADLDTGAGTDTRAVVGLVGSKSGGGVLIPGDATKGLAVDLTATGANSTALKVDGSAVAQPVTDNSGSLTVDQPTGTNLHTVIDSGTVSTITNVVHVDDNSGSLTVDQGTASNLNAQVVGDVASAATDSGNPVKIGAVNHTTPPTYTDGQRGNLEMTTRGELNVNIKQNANSVTVGTVEADGTTNSAITLSVRNYNKVFNGTTWDRLSGDTTGVNVKAIVGALPAGTNAIGKLAANAGVDIGAVEQQGTWTVQPGNTANTTPWLVSNRPGTSGGFSTYHLVSAGSTNATNIKASAGQVFGWYVYNSNAAARKLVFHNTAGTPTAGASVFFAIMIPPSAGANVFTETGIAFSTGIAITTVTDLTDAGATAVAANDLIINIFYA